MEKSLFENLIAILNEYRWRFLKSFLLVLFSNCLLILNPMIFRQAVQSLDRQSQPSSGLLASTLSAVFGSYTTSIWLWASLLITISLLSAIFKYYMRYGFISISRDAERAVRSKLFDRIQNQSASFYDRHGIGELLSRLTNDISAYRDVLGPGIMYPLFFLTIVVPGLIALFSISKTLAAISLIPLITIPILNAVSRSKMFRVSLLVQKGLGDLSNIVQEHFSEIRIVKSYVIEPFLESRFFKFCKEQIVLNVKLACYQGMLYPFFTALTKIITVVLVMFSSYIILNAWGTLSVADFVSFMWIQSYIFFPVLMLAWVIPVYERGRAAYGRLVEIYEEPIEVQPGKDRSLRFAPLADLTFAHLCFSYPHSSQKVLDDINLTIKGGSYVGITGPIGAGKSTLFRLLNREYEIPAGNIIIGGRDIHDYPFEAFYEEIVTVEQIPFLFSRTIAENVRFGREEASFQDVEVVAQYADLHETVQGFPEGYDTVIGERGITLSGGQRQRLAMARAFLVNRSVLLLDDIFSAVDAATEKRIFKSMKEKFKDKTILLITHRAAILEQMDRVIFMKEGKVIEDGPPAELLSKKGHYAALVELQRLG